MSAHSPERVVLAKIGLDGHDRGVRVLARTLRDAGNAFAAVVDAARAGLTHGEIVRAVQEAPGFGRPRVAVQLGWPGWGQRTSTAACTEELRSGS